MPTTQPHPWISKSGRPYTARVRSPACARCGATPDAPVHLRAALTAADPAPHGCEKCDYGTFGHSSDPAPAGAQPFRFLVESYDQRRREVAATIEEADASADDGSAGPDALADALMEVAEGWCRSALSAAPAGARPTNCEHRGDDHGPDGCHNCACSFVPVWAVRAALPSPTPPEAAAGLGEAWAEAEAALPEGTLLLSRWELGVYRAVWSGPGGSPRHSMDAGSAADALRALAVRLHPRPTDTEPPE